MRRQSSPELGRNKRNLRTSSASCIPPGSSGIAGLSNGLESGDRTTENRGVGGSSPPLAIAKSLQTGHFRAAQRSARKGRKGQIALLQVRSERPRPRRHSCGRDEEYTMRFAYGRDPARRPRPICRPRPSRCRGGARRRRSCGVRRTASRQEALRSAQAPIGRRVAAVLRLRHQQRGDRADHQGVPGHARDGAMSAAYVDTPTTAIRTFARGVDRLIRTIDTFP
jgi:hypothetical protein